MKDADDEWNELYRCVAKMIISSHAAADADSEYRKQRYKMRQILMGNFDNDDEEDDDLLVSDNC